MFQINKAPTSICEYKSRKSCQALVASMRTINVRDGACVTARRVGETASKGA